MADTLHRLSFCTAAMGRLDHVRRTLPANIAENAEYPDAEFVLLDYGSNDGLGDWVWRENLHLIHSGRLAYLRLDGVPYFHHAHARNVSFLASTGRVVCNVDADNFMPRGFAFHLNERMNRRPRSIANFGKAPSNTKGRLAAFREDFLRVGGYDELLTGWGWEDKDLRARLCASGCAIQWLDVRHAGFIPHSDARRIENQAPDNRERWLTSGRNASIGKHNMAHGNWVANAGRRWGLATLRRNFADTQTTGVIQPPIPSPNNQAKISSP